MCKQSIRRGILIVPTAIKFQGWNYSKISAQHNPVYVRDHPAWLMILSYSCCIFYVSFQTDCLKHFPDELILLSYTPGSYFPIDAAESSLTGWTAFSYHTTLFEQIPADQLTAPGLKLWSGSDTSLTKGMMACTVKAKCRLNFSFHESGTFHILFYVERVQY